MNWKSRSYRRVLVAIVFLALTPAACSTPAASPTVLVTEAVTDLAEPPAENATAVEPATTSAAAETPGVELEIPQGWTRVLVDQPDLNGEIFVQQDPTLLASFDDPAWAVPLDFAAGALLFTPLPAAADPDALREGMTLSLPRLTDEDFEAMLAGADKAGLINLSAVSQGRLTAARVDSLDGKPAIVLEGTVHFGEEQPPLLQGQIWLTWSDEAFIVFYALATDTVWSQVSAAMDSTRRTLQLP